MVLTHHTRLKRAVRPMKITDKHLAGVLFLSLACLPVGIWVVFLLVGNPANASLTAQLLYTFSPENEFRLFFIFLAMTTVVSLSLAMLWFLSRVVSLPLVLLITLLSVAQVVGYLVWAQWIQGGLSLLPLYWVYRTHKNSKRSVRCARDHR